jgi:hypothetical protein
MKTIDVSTTPALLTGADAPPDRHALALIAIIRSYYTRHFDNRWFQNMLERLSFSRHHLDTIRLLLDLRAIVPADYPRLRAGIHSLGEFIYFSRTRVLPELQRELGLAGFSAQPIDEEDEIARMAKEWFLASLPSKLGKLADLTEELRDCTAELYKAG